MKWLAQLNIADWFSMYRILAAPFLLALVWLEHRQFFVWMLLVSYLTDMVDGFLARRLKIASKRGSQLDSIGDQTTMVIAIIGVFQFEPAFMHEQYQLLIIAFAPYLLQMVLAFKKYGKATAFHTYLAKLSALLQGVFVLSLFFWGVQYWLFYTMVVFSLLETIEEVTLIFLYDEWVSDIKGLYWAMRDKRRLKKAQKGSPYAAKAVGGGADKA